MPPGALAKLDQVEALLRDIEVQLTRIKQRLESPEDPDAKTEGSGEDSPEG
jgi:hypothetical protein